MRDMTMREATQRRVKRRVETTEPTDGGSDIGGFDVGALTIILEPAEAAELGSSRARLLETPNRRVKLRRPVVMQQHRRSPDLNSGGGFPTRRLRRQRTRDKIAECPLCADAVPARPGGQSSNQ